MSVAWFCGLALRLRSSQTPPAISASNTTPPTTIPAIAPAPRLGSPSELADPPDDAPEVANGVVDEAVPVWTVVLLTTFWEFKVPIAWPAVKVAGMALTPSASYSSSLVVFGRKNLVPQTLYSDCPVMHNSAVEQHHSVAGLASCSASVNGPFRTYCVSCQRQGLHRGSGHLLGRRFLPRKSVPRRSMHRWRTIRYFRGQLHR